MSLFVVSSNIIPEEGHEGKICFVCGGGFVTQQLNVIATVG